MGWRTSLKLNNNENTVEFPPYFLLYKTNFIKRPPCAKGAVALATEGLFYN